jgi:hypothetical protein
MKFYFHQSSLIVLLFVFNFKIIKAGPLRLIDKMERNDFSNQNSTTFSSEINIDAIDNNTSVERLKETAEQFKHLARFGLCLQ